MGEMHAIYNLRNKHNVICKISMSRSLIVIEFFLYIYSLTIQDMVFGIRAYHKLCHMASEKASIEPPVVL